MLTLYHAPQSRSSRILWLLEELAAEYDVFQVDIPRQMSGTGAPDPANPHPEKKVPYLVHDGAAMTESVAIMLYLTDLFPQAGLAPTVGEPGRAAYLNWLAYYAGVYEPVGLLAWTGLGDDARLRANFRGVPEAQARFASALEQNPYLLGPDFSAADLLFATMGQWMRDALPPGARVDDWLARCLDRPALKRAQEKDGTP